MFLVSGFGPGYYATIYSSQKVVKEYVINVNTMRVIMTPCNSRKEGNSCHVFIKSK